MLESNLLAILYLVLLLVFLGVSGWFIVRQILRTRRKESNLAQLQKKVKNGEATAADCYALGSIFLEKKLYSQAIGQFQKALKSKDLEAGPDTAAVYNALGFAYAATEQYDLAIRQYKEALQQYPEYVTALKNLGFAYERKQLTAQALACYDQVLEYDPNNATAKKRIEPLRKLVTPSNN
jgi:tetratricopeptide (TPR) repeat protein